MTLLCAAMANTLYDEVTERLTKAKFLCFPPCTPPIQTKHFPPIPHLIVFHPAAKADVTVTLL